MMSLLSILILTQTPTLTQALDKGLKATDLGLGGQKLAARIIDVVRPCDANISRDVRFRHVSGESATMIFTFDVGAFKKEVILVWPHGSKVKTTVFDSQGEWYWKPTDWRSDGKTLFGLGVLCCGNWFVGTIHVFRKESGDWRLTQSVRSEHEISDLRFKNERSRYVRVTTRSYEFRFFDQPHAGPLLLRDTDYRWDGSRYMKVHTVIRRTPLEAFDRLVAALRNGDRDSARRLCPNKDLRRHLAQYALETVKGDPPRLSSPGSMQRDSGRAFEVWGDVWKMRRAGSGWILQGRDRED